MTSDAASSHIFQHINATQDETKWALVIHGGAGSRPTSQVAEYERALQSVIEVGGAELRVGGTALDVVEEIVALLENEPLFNAGRGSVFNAAGEIEMDASIMDGQRVHSGAVSLVRTIKNPVKLARRVMERTSHVYLAGKGAEEFADGQTDIERAPQEYFATEKRRLQLLALKESEQLEDPERHLGTVGAVALDIHGNIAAATSTGGLVGKRFGRIGDSPIVGAGTYADSDVVGVSCTGDGEYMIRSCLAHDIWARMKYGRQSLVGACQQAVEETIGRIGGDAGVIAVDKLGNVAIVCNTDEMYRAYVASSCSPVVGVFAKPELK